MILSMTGYGKAESQMENTKIVVELRGLNSKSLDLSTRMAPQLRNKALVDNRANLQFFVAQLWSHPRAQIQRLGVQSPQLHNNL